MCEKHLPSHRRLPLLRQSFLIITAQLLAFLRIARRQICIDRVTNGGWNFAVTYTIARRIRRNSRTPIAFRKIARQIAPLIKPHSIQEILLINALPVKPPKATRVHIARGKRLGIFYHKNSPLQAATDLRAFQNRRKRKTSDVQYLHHPHRPGTSGTASPKVSLRVRTRAKTFS